MYKLCRDLWEQNKCELPWFNGVKGIFDNTGLSHVWINQAFPNSRWLNRIVKQSLHDQAVQTWAMSVNNSSKCLNYRIFKTELSLETYLDDLPRKMAVLFCKFRCSNHKLPVESGRYIDLPRHQRQCTKCDKHSVGDELHFILECPFLKPLRKKYLPKQFLNQPNVLKFKNVMSNPQHVLSICKFINDAMQLYMS